MKIKMKLMLSERDGIAKNYNDVDSIFENNTKNINWNAKYFEKEFTIKIVNIDGLNMEFDLININSSFVNAFRRILIAEVPMMAIEKVFIFNNTSFIQDEVLAHRLGLIPLKADFRRFSFRKSEICNPTNIIDHSRIRFALVIIEAKVRNAVDFECIRSMYYESFLFSNIRLVQLYSEKIKWIPIGDQITKFRIDEIGPVHDDILIAKLRPGHDIDLKMLAVKGIGKDHAKFQPVGKYLKLKATASYRLLPQIKLKQTVKNEEAQKLKASFSPGVIELHKIKDDLIAKVGNTRNDLCSRNIYRYENLKDYVEVSRVPNHFIFTIESVGALPPNILFLEAIKILQNKCKRIIQDIENKGSTCFL
ncbi:hypothetical protein PGB90_005222 [Kerria lacca]